MTSNPGLTSLISGEWWVPCSEHPIQRGHWILAFLPHVDLVPLQLIAEARCAVTPTDHSVARGRIEQLRISSRRHGMADLPVAGLPPIQNETWAA